MYGPKEANTTGGRSEQQSKEKGSDVRNFSPRRWPMGDEKEKEKHAKDFDEFKNPDDDDTHSPKVAGNNLLAVEKNGKD